MINVYATIQKLFMKYYAYYSNAVKDFEKKLNKMPKGEKKDSKQELYEELKRGLQSLKLISEDPAKYLYTQNDLLYSNVKINGKSLYDALAGIMYINGNTAMSRVIFRVSEIMSRRYVATNGQDINKWQVGSSRESIDVENLLEYNKLVTLNATNSSLKAWIKQFVPATKYAVRSR